MSIETICVDLIGISAILFAIIYYRLKPKSKNPAYYKTWNPKTEINTLNRWK